MSRTVPVSSTQAPGNIVASALWNAGPAASNTFLTNVPLAVVSQVTPQTLTSGTPAGVTFDATQLDTDGMHSNTVNNSRLTCQVAGWYFVKSCAVFAANASGNRGLQICKNGSAYPYSWFAVPAATTFNDPGVETTALVQLSVGDYVEAFAQQSSGGSLATAAVSTITSNLQCMWMHS